MDPESTHLHHAQLAAILGPDPAPFEILISHLMSSSNEQRSQAELIFNLCKQTDPNSLALKLAQLLQFSPHVDARAMSAILLRKQLTPGSDSYLWPRLSPFSHSSLKSILLACVQREEAKTIIKKLCDTVSELASGVLPDNGWPELLPFMFQCVSSDSPKLQESAFLIFAQLSQYMGETLIPHIKHLHAVFLHCLTSSASSDVKIAALSAAINFIQCLSNSGDRNQFQDLLPAMIRTLTEALNCGQEATAQEALELLIELAGTEPRFLRRQLVDVVGSMLQIAEAESLEEGTRHLAIEFVITLAEAREKAPGMMRKLPQFISRLFAILMKMLLDIEDAAAWHSGESEDEDAGETSNYGVGQECLDRISIALGGNTIVPVASEQLASYLAAPEWQKHHAALIALAQITEGCSKVMMKNLEQVVNMVLNSFQDPHPRVRWAAINAVGQLSTDLGPDLQVQYHQRVLPALAAAMDDFPESTCTGELFWFFYKFEAHTASAVLNFSENCTPDILTPYLDGIVSKLLVLLQNGKQMVQEGALTALASVADSSQEHFQKYYDAVIPYLKSILVNATDKSNRMLRAKAMECISLVGMAVGKEKFRDDAKQVMEVLMSLQGSQMEIDDPTAGYMLQAWARLCKCLGQDFLPYMSIVMPPLLQSAQLKPDLTITSADSDSEIDELDDNSRSAICLLTLNKAFKLDEPRGNNINVLWSSLSTPFGYIDVLSMSHGEILCAVVTSLHGVMCGGRDETNSNSSALDMHSSDGTMVLDNKVSSFASYLVEEKSFSPVFWEQQFVEFCIGAWFHRRESFEMKLCLEIQNERFGLDLSAFQGQFQFVETITLGDKRIGIKTSVLEEKATACNMLCCYADELKEGFYPWIDQVAPTMVPLLKFYFHEEVRRAAVSAMPELLCSAKLAVEKGLTQGRNESYIKQLTDYIVPALVEALNKEPDTEICASILDALNECIQICGPLLDESQVGEILGTLIKTFKASFLPFFDELSSYLTPMWVKQCREAALKYYDTYLPFLLEACNFENPDVCQAAVYGLGVCAEFGGSVFKPLVGEALSRLNMLIRDPNALQPENIMSYDNAVSALGKICQFHRDTIDSAQYMYEYLLSEFPHEGAAEILAGCSCVVKLLADKR
ncbi:ARM repeat superfamily protein [Actinidia rufa]|uniref:ARM repeat superfamily protein n=1 Tax=Actinidia rufa TaxID=165716 RepID=A0A7J0GQN5_9ERIC|nr:ARM repeat superfamily protein [Actinidia rufa]